MSLSKNGETTRAAPRLIRAWGQRPWIEHSFRTLKHLLATEACQVQGEDAYYDHLVLRLLASLVLLYTARFVCKSQVTREALLFSLKHSYVIRELRRCSSRKSLSVEILDIFAAHAHP